MLFRGEEHIERWCSQWNFPRGATLTIDQTWQLADAWFQRKAEPDWRRATLDEAEAVFARIGLTGPFWNLRS